MQQLLDVEDVIKTPDLHGDVKIEGFVEITNGDTKLRFKNKFVNAMLIWLSNIVSVNYKVLNATPYLSTWDWDMYLGTDQTTVTLGTTTALTAPIGTAPGTAPSSKSGSTSSPSAGTYRVTFTCTWNAGIVSGTVGEMALYLDVFSTFQSFAWTLSSSGTKQLTSRLAVADTTMTAFTINTSVPLTISWQIQATFS